MGAFTSLPAHVASFCGVRKCGPVSRESSLGDTEGPPARFFSLSSCASPFFARCVESIKQLASLDIASAWLAPLCRVHFLFLPGPREPTSKSDLIV